jgi:hypothetical protein
MAAHIMNSLNTSLFSPDTAKTLLQIRKGCETFCRVRVASSIYIYSLCIHESGHAVMLTRSCVHMSHVEYEVFLKFKGRIRSLR